MLGQRRRRWASINPALAQRLVFAGTCYTLPALWFNPLTTGHDYIRFLIFYLKIKYQRLNVLKIERNINQQEFKMIPLHFVKAE